MGAKGTTTIDFGSAPGSTRASVAVTGQTSIDGTAAIEAFIMRESSADHTDENHSVVADRINLSCGNIVAGTGFTIYATTDLRLRGQFTVRWVWA